MHHQVFGLLPRPRCSPSWKAPLAGVMLSGQQPNSVLTQQPSWSGPWAGVTPSAQQPCFSLVHAALGHPLFLLPLAAAEKRT